MELFDNLWMGLGVAAQPMNLAYCFLGVFLGTLVGVLPGIGALAAISLLLPVTYHIPPTSAIIMLAGVYYGAQYGGSTAAILLNLPGTPSSAVTCLDGYPMAKNGPGWHCSSPPSRRWSAPWRAWCCWCFFLPPSPSSD